MGQCWGTASEARWEQGLFALSALSVSDCKPCQHDSLHGQTLSLSAL